MPRTKDQDPPITGLRAQDLLQYQDLLFASLNEALHFSRPRLYFPAADKKDAPLYRTAQYEAQSRRLFLPLIWEQEPLALFVGSKVQLDSPDTVLPLLTTLARLCLEKIALCKQNTLDQLTGLYCHTAFSQLLTQELEHVLDSLHPGPKSSLDPAMVSHSSNVTLFVIRPDRFEALTTRFGASFAAQVTATIGNNLDQIRPENASLARDKGSFYLFTTQAGPKSSLELAERLRSAIEDQVHQHRLTQERVQVRASIGLADFPRDFQGRELQLGPRDHVFLLQKKAHKALDAAIDKGGNQVQAFAGLLSQGCCILRALSPDRFIISAGRDIGASEGQGFLVWQGHNETGPTRGETTPHKGELALVEVYEGQGLARLISQEQPGCPVSPGDHLSLIPSRHAHLYPANQEKAETSQGLTPLSDFIQIWARRRTDCQRFTLLLLGNLHSSVPQDLDQAQKQLDQLQKTADRISESLPEGSLVARHSANGLIAFLPGLDLTAAFKRASLIWEQALGQRRGLVSMALAAYPCLNDNRADILTNVRQALDHARLLDPPRIACFDSVTLNIAADQHFTRGDLYLASQEYKRALTLDPDNSTARNSLGTCLACLGDHCQARREFKTIIGQEPENHRALYNLGCLDLKEQDLQTAEKRFSLCLQYRPDHLYSRLRLGQLAEKKDDLKTAQGHYLLALGLPEGGAIAHCCLAQLKMQQREADQARAHLHQALSNNPRSAKALHLLAQIYLTAQEDLELAESLARESSLLNPQCPEHWDLWEEILKRQGDNRALQSIRTLRQGAKDRSKPDPPSVLSR